MSHYWTADDPIESRREQVIDWIDDLVEFGPDAVSNACREWRRTQSRRPTPADIRKLCGEARAAHEERLLLAAPPDMDEYARSVGWASEAERRAAIDTEQREHKAKRETARLAQEELAMRIAGPLRPVGSSVPREYSPNELRAGRIALGFEKPEAAE